MTENQIFEAMLSTGRHGSKNFLMTLDPKAPGYECMIRILRQSARSCGRGIRLRGRLGKNNPYRDLYAHGKVLWRPSSQDYRIEHSVRVDVYLK